MGCYQNGTSINNVTYTLRKNGANTTLTCTILAGAKTGSGVSASGVPFVTGDLLDVATPAANTPGVQGSFTVSTG
jgi:hypothetical protein